MGIPSYFSYIVKKHADIVSKENIDSFERLYMDCNSILYDVFHALNPDETEMDLLRKTCEKIDVYIKRIAPQMVFIAFDGVAPFAKMEQQKNRRYKTWFESAIQKSPPQKLSSSMFTPGTAFMTKLSRYVRDYFPRHLIATPDEAGEGEHKLFAHLRKNPTLAKVAVYGLDADLIMLSLFHLPYCDNIFIMREAPAFDDTGDEPLFLDIHKLSLSILVEMNCAWADERRVLDYVFLCFFLGNDFLPHFPSLNLRTHGMQRLLDVYRLCIGNGPRFLLENNQIQWRQVNRLVHELAKLETTFIQQEFNQRKKWKSTEPNIQQLPMVRREEENFIDPNEIHWEQRYYHILFSDIFRKSICINYLQGLEWVTKYYTEGCVDWRWKYQYAYPPLLKDLAPYVPYANTSFFGSCKTKPLRPLTQLVYILPPHLHEHLLPSHVHKLVQEKYGHLFPPIQDIPELTFQWAFCKYLWESHLILPSVSTSIIDEWERRF